MTKKDKYELESKDKPKISLLFLYDSDISLFSVLNNLTNISFLPEYATICGITEQEIGDNFKPELEKMAEVNDWTLPETHDRLKDYYDGYHFSRRNMVRHLQPLQPHQRPRHPSTRQFLGIIRSHLASAKVHKQHRASIG